MYWQLHTAKTWHDSCPNEDLVWRFSKIYWLDLITSAYDSAYLIKLFIIWRLPWPNPLYSYYTWLWPKSTYCLLLYLPRECQAPLGFLHVEEILQSLCCCLRYYNVCLFSHFSLSAPLSSEPTVPSVQTVSGVLEDKATNASTANCWCTKSATNWSQWSVADQFTKWVAELWTVMPDMKNLFEGLDLLVNTLSV